MRIFFSRLKRSLASNGNLCNATNKYCTLSITRFRVSCRIIAFISKYQSCCNAFLSLTRFSENAQRLSNLFIDRPIDALNTSIFWIEYIAKYGNVLQSPAIDLYWWQVNLLDVYAFIVAVIIIALCIVLFVLRKLKNLLFGSSACAKKDSAAIKFKKNK